MRIILKPLGVVVVCAAMATLAVMAARGSRQPGASPSVTNTAPTQKSPGPDAVVYDDGLKNGWENYSWGKYDLAETKHVTSGTCIRGEPSKFEAVSFHHAPISLAPYDRLSFRIHGGVVGGQRLKLVVQYQTAGKTENGAEWMVPPPKAGEWQTVTVELTALGVADKPDVIGFWLQEATGETLPPYYLDDVRFLAPSDAAPVEGEPRGK